MDESMVKLEDLTPVRKRLQVEVPAEAVQAELDRAFQVVGQQARLRGFRPGKAPRSVLERMFGAQVRREVISRLVEETFHRAVEAHQLAVVGTPDIDADDIGAGPLRYSATIEVRPAIALQDLGGIEVGRPPAVVTDEDVERLLAGLRESVAQLRPIEGRTVIEPGDVVTVDVSSRLEGGEPVRRADVHVEAGAGTFPLALERQLVGQHRGVRLHLDIPYPADYGNPGLAGRTAHLEVDIRDLRTKELPPLDDDFARDHGRCGSLAELRTRIRADLEREAVSRADQAVRDAVLEQALGRHQFDLPTSLVDRRVEVLIAGLDLRLPEGVEGERALADVRARARPSAERQVRADLLLDALASRDGIVVSDEEVTAEIDAMAAREQRVVERVRALYDRPEARAALRARMVRDRALDRLVAAAKVMPVEAGESVAREK
jgi:trigger factor